MRLWRFALTTIAVILCWFKTVLKPAESFLLKSYFIIFLLNCGQKFSARNFFIWTFCQDFRRLWNLIKSCVVIPVLKLWRIHVRFLVILAQFLLTLKPTRTEWLKFWKISSILGKSKKSVTLFYINYSCRCQTSYSSSASPTTSSPSPSSELHCSHCFRQLSFASSPHSVTGLISFHKFK